MPKPKARANADPKAMAGPKDMAGPTKSRVQPSRKKKPIPVPKPAPKPKPRPRTRQTHRPFQPIMENASIQEWLSVQREKERRAAEAEALEVKAAQNRYQAKVNAELRDYAHQSMMTYRQRKANDAMREVDPNHEDKIYSDTDLNDIEEMLGPFTVSNRHTLNPMQVETLRERVRERMTQNRAPKKRTGTLKARKHKGQGTGF